MSPEWMEWIEENMPAAMLEEFKAAWRHEGNWRDNRIAALEAELAQVREESRELLTIAHMDGYHRGSQGLKALIINNTILRDRVVELKAERDEFLRAVQVMCDNESWWEDRLSRAEAERDEALGRVEKLERVRLEAREVRRLEPNFLSHMDEYRTAQKRLDIALAECGEGKP